MAEYSRAEEWVNSMTHYVGVILGLVGLGALIVHSEKLHNLGYTVGGVIFCNSIIILYSMSGTYHILGDGKAKKIFKILDHASIFILIAGSYTPFLLGVFEGRIKWIFLGIQWGLTAVGIIFKIFFTGRYGIISTTIYLLMGWMIVFVFKDLKVLITPLSLNLLVAGGLSYTIGVIFYAMKKVAFAHSIWHLFVLGGTVLQFFSVYFMI